MKTCTKCGKNKSLSEFCRDKSRKDGYNNKCKICVNAYNKKYYLANSEKLLSYQRDYQKTNPSKKAYQKEYYRTNCESICAQKSDYYQNTSSKVRLKKVYNLTQSEYKEILKNQNNACAICGKTPKENGRKLSVDHSHVTGKIRGLLCISCNMNLGKLGDEFKSALGIDSKSQFYREMLEYLEKHD